MTGPHEKRAKGTGTLFQHKSGPRIGYWVGIYRATDATGKVTAKSVGSWDHDTAEAKLDALVGGEKLPANVGELRAVKAEVWDECIEEVEDVEEGIWVVRKMKPNPYKTNGEGETK